jgi:GNAT superfamily N-acetyltransferase
MPTVPGLIFRHFRGEQDYPAMAAVINASKVVDGIERTSSAQEMAHTYAHLSNCDPRTDMIVAEVNGEVVGYGRGWWQQEPNGPRIYGHVGFLKPAWRRRGIGGAMLQFLQRRLREIAATQPDAVPRFFNTYVADTETGTEALLQRDGYTAVRHSYDMARPTLDDLPDAPMPAGLEVRPVLPEHYRAIWDADNEAFQDHWGYSPPTEADYQAWLSSPVIFTPELWRVAWDIETN